MCGSLRGWAFGCIYLVELRGMGDKKGVHYNIDTCGLFGVLTQINASVMSLNFLYLIYRSLQSIYYVYLT